MKFSAILILPTLFLAAALPSLSQAPAGDSITPVSAQTAIEPGQGLGALKIGDSQDRALELFPLKQGIDQQWEDKCGSALDWVDSSNPNGRGDVIIHLKKGKVFQIESSSSRFHTAEGIATFDSPSAVRDHYKGLAAYTLLTPPAPNLGDRPLVFWVDKKKGIAFTLAYYPKEHKRYIYKIIVFVPNKDFCPEEETINSSKWQAIPPYSLEPPADLSPERSY
jgi:hypothetical protein